MNPKDIDMNLLQRIHEEPVRENVMEDLGDLEDVDWSSDHEEIDDPLMVQLPDI